MLDTEKLIAKSAEPLFYQRVLFLALISAQQVATEDPDTENHEARRDYANMILRGEENGQLLAVHVIAANAVIRDSILAGDEPEDADIEFVLASIWTARALAFYTPLIIDPIPDPAPVDPVEDPDIAEEVEGESP